MKLGISNIAWPATELDSALAIMETLNVRGLEIAPGLAFPNEPDAFDPSATAVSDFKDRIEARGIELISMQSLLFGQTDAKLFGTESQRDTFQAAIAKSIQLAGRLGIPNIVMGSPTARAIPEAMDTAMAEQIAVDTFRGLGDLAQSLNVKIAMEPNPAIYGTNFLTTMTEAISFVDRAGHPAVTVNFDLGALHVNGNFDQAADLFSQTAARISHVHISEPQLQPAPVNAAAFAALAQTLLKQGYEYWFSIEMRATSERPLDNVEARLSACVDAVRAKMGDERHD